MVPAILRSRKSLLREIIKLQAEIIELTKRFNLVVNWVNTQYEVKAIPEDVAKAIQQSVEIPDCLDEPEPAAVSDGKTDTSSGDFCCRTCGKKLKNRSTLKSHEKEHLPPEVLVPIVRRKADKRIFKRHRHAYRCLTCGVILTERRKYLAHVNKHSKTADWKEVPEKPAEIQGEPAGSSTAVRKNPFVKLVDIKFLNQHSVVNLENKYGISNVNSVIQGLLSQLHSNSNAKPIFEEEVPYFPEIDGNKSCDPLADCNSLFWEQSADSEDDMQISTDLTRISESDISMDAIKEEIKEECDNFEEKICEDQEDNVEITDSNDLIKSSTLEPSSPKDCVVTNCRKSRHKVIVENEDCSLSTEAEFSNSAIIVEPSLTRNSANLRKSLHRIVYENEDSDDSATCDLESKDSQKDDSNGVTCDICNKKLKNAAVLRTHRNVHLPPEVLIPLYDDGMTGNDNFRQRYKYRCLICHIVITDKRKYVSHVKAHEKELRRPQTSNSNNKQENSIVRQNENSDDKNTQDLNSKNSPNDDNSEVTCDICNKKYKNKEVLRVHRGEHLPPEVLIPLREVGIPRTDYIRPRYKYRCLVCNIIMTDKRKYVAHVKSHKRGSKPSSFKKKPEAVEYTCDICNVKCRTKYLLKSHQTVHLPPGVVLPYHSKMGYRTPLESRHRYRCTYCEEIFTDKRRYAKHITGHKRGNVFDDDGPWNCKFCNKAFKTRKVFIRHEAAHENAKNGNDNFYPEMPKKTVICEVCGQGLDSNYQLRVHMRKHTGSRPYLCSQCGKGFIRKSYLLNHELIHSDKRAFKCSFCDKSFKQLQSKYLHERRHKGHTVVCSLCGFTFAGKSSLNSHIKGVHENIRPFQCTLCDTKFKTQSCLKTHMKTHTNPNSRQRSINRDVDPLKAAAKRRHKPHHNITVRVIPSLVNNLPVN